MTYLVGEEIVSKSVLPFLEIHIDGNSIRPYRSVFPLLHKHEEIEFIIVEKHELHIQTTMSEVVVKEGEGVFIPKNKLHILKTGGRCVCKGYLFPDELLVPKSYEKLYEDMRLYTDNPLLDVVHIGKDEQLILEALEQVSSVSKAGNDHLLLSSLHKVWALFVESLDLEELYIHKSRKEKGDTLMKYLDYIHVNFSKTISINDIAGAGFTSVSECNRIFKSILKVTAYDYLIKYRIDRSLSLIKDGIRLSEIAHMVGYNSPSQYTKYFKKHMLMTPSDYKKRSISS
ncbi:AraC family transcriptional regulator [Acidaminobacter sp. JC074]|uniref:AraC family transcriptional regulator n=1 Tax=Acidaminobacter sp. JC074 TaxID=2530199 RepID=UPI001F1058FA|nr:AraC family transcriptional regulator [Acidaminobacter sp. JC074]MCH4888565.1 AraC family transcriptional regulator [Acidaminobacter sp. JC074]